MDDQPEGQLLTQALLTLSGVTLKRMGVPLWPPLDLCLAPGEALLIRGDTGIGKSSLLQLMAGLLPADTGQIRMEGRAALVMQDPDLQLVREMIGPEVALWLETLGMAPDAMAARVRQALDKVGLNLPFTHPCRALSQGQQYRLLLACQLVAHPQLLLLDEPWGQLDEQGFRSLKPLLLDLKRRGVALVICDHCHAPYEDLCDRTLTLAREGLSSAPVAHSSIPPWPSQAPGQWRLRLKGSLPLAERRLSLSDLSLAQGEAAIISGANGTGKTTLARAIVGLGGARPDAIEVRSNCRLALVCQSPSHQLSARTVIDELALGLSLQGLTEAQANLRIQSELEQLGLDHLSQRSPQTLSYGQQHLVAIAAQLCLEPDLLILDDPFAGLDDDSRQRLWLALQRRVAAGGSAVITSHHPLETDVHQWQIQENRLVAL
ncbi:ATP-binding cassette domain-containing protein [Ferrimonas futtsuensis]|uniref:ATP-binding cassette domain-containing protein n=1 Tax=Ferrimonas futtsuensis TaxID=364764 RepID=UPI000428EB7C|nr:ABC transporter ATP-binding protein [Ferrimonas futtsuensis]